MENRFCYRTGETPSVTPHREQLRTTVERAHAMQRDVIAQRTNNDLVYNTALNNAQNKNFGKEIDRNFAEKLPSRLNAVGVAYAPKLLGTNNIEGQLSRLPAAQQTEIQGILDAITTPLDTDAAQGSLSHRYVRMQKGNEEKKQPDWYGIDFQKVKNDKESITRLRESGAFPELQTQFLRLEQALEDYVRQDQRYALATLEKGPINQVDRAFKEMGRMGGIVIIGGMAVLTGFIGLFNMKRDGIRALLPAMLYASVTGLLVNPGAVKRFFGTKYEHSLDALENAMGGKGLKEASETYDIAGPAWENLLSSMMTNPASTKAFIKHLDTLGTQGADNEKIIDDYIAEHMSGDKIAIKNLRQMISDKAFASFANRIMSTSDADAQSVVLDYVRQGAARTPQMRAAAQKAQAALAPTI